MKLTLFILWIALQPVGAFLYCKAIEAKREGDSKSLKKTFDNLYKVLLGSIVTTGALTLSFLWGAPFLFTQGVWDYIASIIFCVVVFILVAIAFFIGMSLWVSVMEDKELVKNK